MKERSPENGNSRLVQLIAAAKKEESPENDLAVVNELLHGEVVLLVPTEPPDEHDPNAKTSVVFTHTDMIDDALTLLVFTGEAAVRQFATEDMYCMGLPSGDLLRACLQQGFGAVLLDPDTPNEICVTLTPFTSGEN